MIATGIGLLVLARICAAFSDAISFFGQVINVDRWYYASITFALIGTGCLAWGVISFAWRFLP